MMRLVPGSLAVESSGAADGAEQTGPDVTGAESADVTGEPPDADPCDVPSQRIAVLTRVTATITPTERAPPPPRVSSTTNITPPDEPPPSNRVK